VTTLRCPRCPARLAEIWPSGIDVYGSPGWDGHVFAHSHPRRLPGSAMPDVLNPGTVWTCRRQRCKNQIDLDDAYLGRAARLGMKELVAGATLPPNPSRRSWLAG
jgi:hypothetical protein